VLDGGDWISDAKKIYKKWTVGSAVKPGLEFRYTERRQGSAPVQLLGRVVSIDNTNSGIRCVTQTTSAGGAPYSRTVVEVIPDGKGSRVLYHRSVERTTSDSCLCIFGWMFCTPCMAFNFFQRNDEKIRLAAQFTATLDEVQKNPPDWYKNKKQVEEVKHLASDLIGGAKKLFGFGGGNKNKGKGGGGGAGGGRRTREFVESEDGSEDDDESSAASSNDSSDSSDSGSKDSSEGSSADSSSE
jgi:hypothetical protein